jgi:hypothetical protein
MTGVPVLWERTDETVLETFSSGSDTIAKCVNSAGRGTIAQPGAASTTTGSSPTTLSTSSRLKMNAGSISQSPILDPPDISDATFSNSFTHSTSAVAGSGVNKAGGTTNSSSKSLSSRAKAAIGITIPLFILATILATFFYMRRRNSHRLRNDARKSQEIEPVGGKRIDISELLGLPSGVHELPGSKLETSEGKTWERHELDSAAGRVGKTEFTSIQWGRHELDVNEPRVLESNDRPESSQFGSPLNIKNSDAARLSDPFAVDATR